MSSDAPEVDKAHWELEKLKLEVANLRQPYLRQPASWLALITLALSIGANIFQYSKTQRDEELAQIKHDKLELESAKLERDNSQMRATTRQQLADVSQLVESQKQRLERLKSEVESLTGNRDALLKREALLAQVGEIQRSAMEVQAINLSATENLSNPTVYRTASRWQQAREQEQKGFQALIDGRFEEALTAFQAAEDAVNGYHYAYELARLLRGRRGAFSDPAKRRDILKLIVERYTRGAPPEFVERLKALAAS